MNRPLHLSNWSCACPWYILMWPSPGFGSSLTVSVTFDKHCKPIYLFYDKRRSGVSVFPTMSIDITWYMCTTLVTGPTISAHNQRRLPLFITQFDTNKSNLFAIKIDCILIGTCLALYLNITAWPWHRELVMWTVWKGLVKTQTHFEINK